jgi:sulfoxide reductase heme-binding subunit YedZ
MKAWTSGSTFDGNLHVRFADRLKIVFCIICLMPVLRLVFLAFTLGLGANPIEKVIHTTGDWALNFLLLTLTITPLCSLTGWSWPAKLRKMSGLFSFLYAGLHFITYVVLDQGLSWSAISDDVIKHKRIAVGFGSLLLLVPPAVTSTSSIKRLLGYERWKNLQSTVYAAAVGGCGPLPLARKERYEAAARLCGSSVYTVWVQGSGISAEAKEEATRHAL